MTDQSSDEVFLQHCITYVKSKGYGVYRDSWQQPNSSLPPVPMFTDVAPHNMMLNRQNLPSPTPSMTMGIHRETSNFSLSALVNAVDTYPNIELLPQSDSTHTRSVSAPLPPVVQSAPCPHCPNQIEEGYKDMCKWCNKVTKRKRYTPGSVQARLLSEEYRRKEEKGEIRLVTSTRKDGTRYDWIQKWQAYNRLIVHGTKSRFPEPPDVIRHRSANSPPTTPSLSIPSLSRQDAFPPISSQSIGSRSNSIVRTSRRAHPYQSSPERHKDLRLDQDRSSRTTL